MSNHRQVSGWATGGVGFAAAILIMIGGFQAITALAAIFNDDFFRKPADYAFDLDPTAWGWIHLPIAVALIYTGISIYRGKNWAAVTGIVLAMFSAFANFFFIPLYPFWAILVIALDVWVIWALSAEGD